MAEKRDYYEVLGVEKGADEAMASLMDGYLENYAKAAKSYNPGADENSPGAGAAGGMGFAFKTFLGAKLERGIELVLGAVGLKEKLIGADLAITGEGRLDGQSGMGKAPVGVARVAKKYGKTVIAFAGAVTQDARALNASGIDAFFPILKSPCSLESAMNIENAKANLADTAEQAFRIIKTVKETTKNEICN